MNTTKKTKERQEDKKESTYRWEIYLDPLHPVNSPNVKFLTGWSKLEGWDERINKQEVLMGCIVRLAQNGFLQRIKYIDFFCRNKNESFYNIKTESQILTMKKNDYILFLPVTHKHYASMVIFLDKLYKCAVLNEDISHLKPFSNKKDSKDESFLNWQKHTFANNLQLENYLVKLIKSGHAYGAVEHFKKMYLLNKPFKN